MLLVSVRQTSPNVDVIASHKIRPAASVAATGMAASAVAATLGAGLVLWRAVTSRCGEFLGTVTRSVLRVGC